MDCRCVIGLGRVRRQPFTRLGHESVETTQIYTHVMQKPGLGVKSPLDAM